MHEVCDVFFSYHWRDHAAVERIARALIDRGIGVFLDRWYLAPGQPWPQALEAALAGCRAVAVFLGPEGLGSWQQQEKNLALDRQVREPGFPVIPVLLAHSDPGLGFLKLNTWIDFTAGGQADSRSIEVLIAAIRGEPPGPEAGRRIESARATICPYRGLRPFREEDEPFFFGRAAFTETLTTTLARQPFVAVVGASGSGKSSVVRAGLIPRLRRGEDGRIWEAVSFVPTDRPLASLAASLLPLLEPDLTEVDRLTEVGKLARRLAKGKVYLRDVTSRILAKQPGTERLLLFADQWEELYTLCTDEAIRTAFVAQLLEVVRSAAVTVVLTLRGDFYGRALSERAFSDQLQDAVVNIGPMTRDELAETITRPAEIMGLAFEPGLVETILDDVGNEPGSLPLLEFLLEALWKERRGTLLHYDAYQKLGRVAGAIAHRADEVFTRELDDRQREAAKRLLIRMVRPGEGVEDTRQRAAMPEADPEAETTLRKLADARLVVTERDPASGHETVEVAHEALIRDWQRLRGWVDQDREFLRTRERVAAQARLWEDEGKPADRLLPPGRPLAEGEDLLATRRADLDADLIAYIEASLAADEERRRQAETVADAERQRELADAQRLASQTLLANWYAEQAIDITVGFVKKAVQLSDRFQVPRSAIEVLLTEADAAFEQLMQEGKSSPHELHEGHDVASQLRSGRVQLLMSLADHYGIIGNTEKKWCAAEQARDMLKELVTEHASNPEWLRQLALSQALLGEMHADRMQLEDALAEYRASRSIREKLWKDHPSDPDLQRDLSISDIKIGDVNFEQGHLEEALDSFRSALEISEPLARADRRNIEHQRDVLVINHMIGDVLAKQGDINGAAKSYRTSLDIAEQLAAADPSNIQLQRDLAASHERLGSNLEDQGDMEAALAAYQASLSITERLAADDPQKVPIQHDLSLGHENVGRILLKQHQIDAALAALRSSLVIAERLAADHADASLQRDLSMRLNNMGDALKEQGDLQAALDHYRRSLAICKHLAAADPPNTELQRHVLQSHNRIDDIVHKQELQETIGEYQAYI